MASNSDNHDVAMVHNVGAKLILDCPNCTINVSEDTQSIFRWVKPFQVQRDSIWADWGALNRHPVFLSQGSGVPHSGPWWLLEKENVKFRFHLV
jgi:hypothetical protein